MVGGSIKTPPPPPTGSTLGHKLTLLSARPWIKIVLSVLLRVANGPNRWSFTPSHTLMGLVYFESPVAAWVQNFQSKTYNRSVRV